MVCDFCKAKKQVGGWGFGRIYTLKAPDGTLLGVTCKKHMVLLQWAIRNAQHTRIALI